MKLDTFSDQLTELGLATSGERYKLVGLYAYNAFYDAVQDYVTEVNDGIVVQPNYPISGIYLNQKNEEDTIDVEIAYCLESPAKFNMKDVLPLIGNAAYIIGNVKDKKYISGNEAAESILREYLHPEDGTKIPPFNIRVLTNVDLDENAEYKVASALENIDPGVKGVDISVSIVFGHNIESLIESNIEHFDFVREGKLVIDEPNNKMSYASDSIVVNVSALSLKQLWKKEGDRGLLAMNLRYYIKNQNIDSKITNSILDDYEKFWYLNNGIIIVCDSFELAGKDLKLKNFSIVNGGQTTRMIGTVPFNSDFYILAKVIKAPAEMEAKNLFVSQVAEASNTQKPIKAKDIIANRVEQRNLKALLGENGIFLEIKRGEKAVKTKYPEPWQKTKNNELAQDLYAFVYLQPGPARNNVSQILQDENKYSTIFIKHQYSVPLIKSVLFLEKAYRRYVAQRTSKKNGVIDPTVFGLIKNGMFYCLATIGYIMKLAYCPAFENTMRKYQNAQIKDKLQCEQAFDMGFIDPSMSFKTFEPIAFNLFDNVINHLMKPVFLEAKGAKPDLAYSNWTKTNTGFSAIVSKIEIQSFACKNNDSINMIMKAFPKATEKQIEDNGNLYNHNSKSLLAAMDGEMSGDDKALRDDLFLLRMQYSTEKHIPEKKIMTDKMIDKIVAEKPLVRATLRKIVSGTTDYYLGDKIIELVSKNIK